MANRTSTSALTLFPRFSRYTSGVTIAFGLIALTGWAFHIYRFKAIIAGQIDVKANAAICFILIGLALWLTKEGDANRYKKALSRSLALTAGLVGLLSFVEYLWGWDLGIDQLLFRVSAEDIAGSVRPGLMSPIAAADFLLLGTAIPLLDGKGRWSHWLRSLLVAVAAVVASFGVLDFVLDPNNTHTHIAPTTALVLFLFSFAVLCARTQWGLGALLTGSTEGARWLRRSIPGALAVLIAYGALLAKPILTTAHFTWLEATLIGISAAVLLMAFVGWTAVSLDRSEHQRKRLEQASNFPARQLDVLMDRFEESLAESGLRRWSIAGIVVGMILAVLGGFDSVQSLRQASENDDWVARTHAVSAALNATLAHTVDIEDGTRSFAATGDPGFLGPAQNAKAAIDSDLGTLRSLTADSASQQTRLERLSTQINERIDAAESTIAYRQRAGLIPPEDMFLLGKQRMDAVRSTITEMQAEESRLLEQRRKAQAISRQRTLSISLISALIGIVILVLAALVVLREIRRTSMMRAQILALNEELECRVAERTGELRESEQRLRIALEAANSGAWEWDLRTNQNVWSDGLWKLYGLEADSCEPSYEAWRRMVHPDDRAPSERMVSEAARGGHEINFEFRVQHPDGAIRWLLSRGRPMRDEAGKPVRFLGIVVDISDRKRAEEALRESEARLRLFIEHAPAALAMFDRDMRYLQVSRRWLTDYRMNDRDPRGVSHYEIFPEIPERWKDAHGRGLAGEIVCEERDRFERQDGTVQWIRWEIRPWYETSGEVGGIVLFSEDMTAAKQAEEALRESEERLRALVNASSDVVYRMSPDWSEMRQLDGRGFIADTTAPIKDWLPAYIHPDDQALVTQTIQDAIRNKSIFELEHRVRQTDGSLGWTLSRAVPWLDANGHIIEWIGMASNVTSRKLAEETLRESEQRVRALMESTAEAILGDDPQGNCTFCNPAALRLLGYKDQAELLGKNLHATMHHSQADGTPLSADDCPIAQAVRGGYAFHSDDLVLWRKDGTCFPAECWSHPVSKDWHSVGSVLTFLDISERKRAEEAIRKLNRELEDRVEQRTAQLHESEQRVRRKLDSILSPEGDLGDLELSDILDVPAIQALMEDFYAVFRVPTALLDLPGNVLTAVGWQSICVKFHRANSDSARNCTESDVQLSAGVAAGEFKIYKCKNNMWDLATPIIVGGHHIGNLFCGQFFFADEAIDYELFRAQARKYGFNEQEYMAALDAAPRLSRAEIHASMAFLARLAKMISQLSYSSIQIARSSAQVARANADLAASNKELEAFTYSVSHDLRAPLRHINGFSKMLLEEFGPVLPAEAQHYVGRISQGTRRMGLLVDDLLNLARVGRQELRLQVTGLRSLVDEIIAELQPDCLDRQVEWKIGALPFVDCDPGLLKQVLLNLLSNSLKFTRPRVPAVIEVGQREENGALVIYVRDNGVGFSMKYADKLFGVFQRLHRQEDFEGTGVGLATVQRIIQKHGGRIWAEADLGRGATFYFTLGGSPKTANKANAAVAGDKV